MPQELDPSEEAPNDAEACTEEDRQRQLLVEEAMHQQMDMQKQLQTQLEVRRCPNTAQPETTLFTESF